MPRGGPGRVAASIQILAYPKDPPKQPKLCPSDPKAPIGGNFRLLCMYMWIFFKKGFVLAKPSFSWLRGVPTDILCSTLCTMFFNVILAATFLRFIGDLDVKRCPRGP